MGRSKKVDRSTARQLALKAFWVNGYSGLSVRALEQLSGINRFALQTEFGGKDALFKEVAELYTAAWDTSEGQRLREGGLDDLRSFFTRRASSDLPQEFNSGCLILNMLGGDQPQDPDIRHVVTSFLENVEGSFAAALHNERARGSLRSEIDIDASAQMLLGAIIGMNLIAKQNGDSSAASGAASAIGRTIEQWRADTPANVS